MTIKQQGGVFGRNPTFNDLTADGSVSLDGPVVVNESGNDADFRVETASDPNGLFVDASTSRIGMGTGTPTSDLHMYDANNVIHTVEVASGGSGVSSIRLKHATRHYGMYVGTTNNLIFYDYGAPAERMRITSAGDLSLTTGNLVIGTSGKGIDFSATAGTGTSELFDDYEEGTWTPTISTTGTALSAVTYDPVTGGKYTKVGNLVHIQGIVRTDAITVGGATGSVQISGLPFSSASNTGSTADGSSGLLLQYSASFLGENPTTAVVGSSSTNAILYYRNAADGGSAGLQAADLGTGANANFFYFSGTYVAA